MARRGTQTKEMAAAAGTTVGFVDERPEHLSDEGRGNEGVSTQDMVIPRLSIVQDLSPQRKRNDPAYIKGAEEGMIFNTATNRLYGTSVVIIPVLFRKEFIIWKDRKKGGGFKGNFGTELEAVKAMERLEDGKDCEVIDTAQHFVLVVDPDTQDMESAVISMSKSQMKVSRRLNTIIQMQNMDRWARGFEMSVVPDQNAQGQDYFNWSVKQLGYVNESMAAAAEQLYEAVRSGARDVARDDEHAHGDDKDTEY